MPQIGHLPGALDVTLGCIGQTYLTTLTATGAAAPGGDGPSCSASVFVDAKGGAAGASGFAGCSIPTGATDGAAQPVTVVDTSRRMDVARTGHLRGCNGSGLEDGNWGDRGADGQVVRAQWRLRSVQGGRDRRASGAVPRHTSNARSTTTGSARTGRIRQSTQPITFWAGGAEASWGRAQWGQWEPFGSEWWPRSPCWGPSDVCRLQHAC